MICGYMFVCLVFVCPSSHSYSGNVMFVFSEHFYSSIHKHTVPMEDYIFFNNPVSWLQLIGADLRRKEGEEDGDGREREGGGGERENTVTENEERVLAMLKSPVPPLSEGQLHPCLSRNWL